MSNIEDMKSVRSFLLKLSDGRTLRLVEKKNYDRLVERIKELEEALLKVKDKNTTLFITCRNSIPKQKVKDMIEEYFEDEEWLIEHDLKALCDDEKECREYYINKKIALKDIKKNILDKLNKLLNNY